MAWLRRARPHQSLRALGPVPLMLLAALVACAAIAAGLFVTDIA